MRDAGGFIRNSHRRLVSHRTSFLCVLSKAAYMQIFDAKAHVKETLVSISSKQQMV